MKNKEELLRELEDKFNITKKELKFKLSFEEIDSIFFIRDAVLSAGFVSENFSRQLCWRIFETYNNWNNYLHSLIIPNPQNMLNINESKMFNEAEKKEITQLIVGSMALMSANALVGLTKDRTKESKFINESVEFWRKTFNPQLIKVMEKINEGWNKK